MNRRVSQKSSPIARVGARRNGGTGIMFTEQGEPYISMWPQDRKQFDLRVHPRQSVEEAAQWAVKERCRLVGF